jgi:multisubunit Na+/H+ antiporter MnhB subunit
MPANILVKIAVSVVIGAVVYAAAVIFLSFFAPVMGLVAGFFSVVVFLLLTDLNENEQIISLSGLLYVGVVAVLSLLVGYLFLYFFKPEIIHDLTCYAKDFITFPDFIISTCGICDILCAIFGGIVAYMLLDLVKRSTA